MSGVNRDKLGEWLSAYLDGELNESEARQVDQFVRENPEARKMLDELRSTAEAVASLPRHLAPQSLAAEIQSHVERSALIGEVETPVPPASGWQTPLRALLSMAAALFVVVGGWWFVTYEQPSRTQPQAAPSRVTSKESSKEVDRPVVRRKAFGERSARKSRPSDGSERLVDAMSGASFEQKLAAGLGVRAIRTHAFKNETVRLRVTVQSEKERDAVAGRLVSYFGGQALKDLKHEKADSNEFFYQGIPEKNFDDVQQRQVLVRASQERMDGLLDAIRSPGDRDLRVKLSSGLLSVHGWDGTRGALASINAPDSQLLRVVSNDAATGSHPLAPAISGSSAATKPVTNQSEPLSSLMRSIGAMADASSGRERADSDDSGSVEGDDTALIQRAEPEKRSARRGSTKSGVGAKSGKLDKRRTLVEKRMQALEESRRRKRSAQPKRETSLTKDRTTSKRKLSPKSEVPTTGRSATSDSDSLITLVIEVKVATKKPVRKDGANRSK